MTFCHALDGAATNNASGVNQTVTISVNHTVNAINTTINIIDGNGTTVASNSSSDNSSMEAVVTESTSGEEVQLSPTPVMTDCINATLDPTSECMVNMFNLAMECANITGATQGMCSL